MGGDQPGSRNARLDQVQAGGRLARGAEEGGLAGGVRSVRAEQRHRLGSEGAFGPRSGIALRQVPAIPAVADDLAVRPIKSAQTTIWDVNARPSCRALLYSFINLTKQRQS